MGFQCDCLHHNLLFFAFFFYMLWKSYKELHALSCNWIPQKKYQLWYLHVLYSSIMMLIVLILFWLFLIDLNTDFNHFLDYVPSHKSNIIKIYLF